MRYYVRKQGSKAVEGAFTLDELRALPDHLKPDETLVAPAQGQSMHTLLSRTEWEPLGALFRSVGRDPSATGMVYRPLLSEPVSRYQKERYGITTLANVGLGMVILQSLLHLLALIAVDGPSQFSTFLEILTRAVLMSFGIVAAKMVVLILADIAEASPLPDAFSKWIEKGSLPPDAESGDDYVSQIRDR